MLEVGTGTGLLALMYAQQNTSPTIHAIEVEEEACEQAKENIDASPYAERIRVIKGDIKSVALLKKYDCIISNPPFYENEIRSADQKKNLARHHLGLTLAQFLKIIETNLSMYGNFYLLLPFKRNEEMKRLVLKRNLSLSRIVFVKQSTKHDYFRVMISGNLSTEKVLETSIEEISILNDKKEYTEEFKELLRVYYLNV